MAKQTGDIRVDGVRLRQLSLVTSPKRIEYVESSHRSVLARESQRVSAPSRSQKSSRAPSMQSSIYRRPHTPVPSLTADDLSPISASARSPITPTFDQFGDCYQSLTYDSVKSPERVNPIHGDQMQLEDTHLATCRPNQTVPVRNIQYTAYKPLPRDAEEVSFMDWDEDDSKVQRVKQSFGFNRPNRPKKLETNLLKSPEWHLNALPRLPSPKSPPMQSLTPVCSRSPQRQSSTSNFSRPRQSPRDTLMPPPPPPKLTHTQNVEPRHRASTNSHTSEEVRLLPIAYVPPSASVSPSITDSNTPSESSSAVSTRSTPYKTWDDYDYRATMHENDHMASITPTVTNESGTVPKSKRIRDIVHGVVKRISKRDLRKDFERK